MLAGAWPRPPAPTSRSSAHIASNESRNAGQCSRSAPWRIFSPTRAASPPQAPSQTASFQASR